MTKSSPNGSPPNLPWWLLVFGGPLLSLTQHVLDHVFEHASDKLLGRVGDAVLSLVHDGRLQRGLYMGEVLAALLAFMLAWKSEHPRRSSLMGLSATIAVYYFAPALSAQPMSTRQVYGDRTQDAAYALQALLYLHLALPRRPSREQTFGHAVALFSVLFTVLAGPAYASAAAVLASGWGFCCAGRLGWSLRRAPAGVRTCWMVYAGALALRVFVNEVDSDYVTLAYSVLCFLKFAVIPYVLSKRDWLEDGTELDGRPGEEPNDLFRTDLPALQVGSLAPARSLRGARGRLANPPEPPPSIHDQLRVDPGLHSYCTLESSPDRANALYDMPTRP